MNEARQKRVAPRQLYIFVDIMTWSLPEGLGVR